MTEPAPALIGAEKSALRRASARIRRDQHERLGDRAGILLAAAFPLDLARRGAVVSAYWPIGDEIDPRPLMLALEDNGCRLALPAVVAKHAALRFRFWRPGDALEPGPHGTMHPLQGAGEADPDIVLLPMLAFTDSGARLGYGGGYYDRTLAEIRARRHVIAVGLAYQVQRADNLPVAAMDQPLDWIVTEAGAVKVVA